MLRLAEALTVSATWMFIITIIFIIMVIIMFSHHSTKYTDIPLLNGFVISVVYVCGVGVDLCI